LPRTCHDTQKQKKKRKKKKRYLDWLGDGIFHTRKKKTESVEREPKVYAHQKRGRAGGTSKGQRSLIGKV